MDSKSTDNRHIMYWSQNLLNAALCRLRNTGSKSDNNGQQVYGEYLSVRLLQKFAPPGVTYEIVQPFKYVLFTDLVSI